MSGKPTGRRLEIAPELYDILSRRRNDKGWDSIRQFALNHMNTLGLSAESVGRAFIHNPFKGLEVHNLVNVMHHLEYSRTEIVELLKKYTNDEMMVKLLGDASAGSDPLTPEEDALLSATRAMRDKVPSVYGIVAGLLGPLAAAHRVDIAEQIGTLTKTGHIKQEVNKRSKTGQTKKERGK